MAGCTITGMPRCGKSYWLKKIGIPHLRRQGIAVSVLDPVLGCLEPNVAKAAWGADWVTDQPLQFVDACKASSGCVWVVDEVGRWAKNYEHISAIEYIPVASGNRGNLGIFVAQRIMMIPPNIRNMCDTAVIFSQRMADLEELAALMNEPAILQAATFEKGQYMMVEPFKTPTIHRLFTPEPSPGRQPITPEREQHGQEQETHHHRSGRRTGRR